MAKKLKSKRNLLNNIKVGNNAAKSFTLKELNSWKEYTNNRTLVLSEEQTKMISKLYSKTFSLPYFEAPKNTSQRPTLKMIERLDKVYETYIN